MLYSIEMKRCWSYFFLNSLITSILLTAAGHVWAAPHRILRPDGTIETCESQLTAKPNGRMVYERAQLFRSWYMTVDAASTSRVIVRSGSGGERTILSMTDLYGKSHQWPNLILDAKAPDNDQFYYGRLTVGEDSSVFTLFNINDPSLSKLVDDNFSLTWKIYEDAGTVTQEEIESFKKLESQLDPRRKVTFVSETASGKIVSVIRLYDGSTYPAFYLGSERPLPDDSKPLGKYKLPLELRYTHLNFREENNYIFEPGRQAVSPEVPDAFYHQLSSMTRFFTGRFGTNHTGPEELKKRASVC